MSVTKEKRKLIRQYIINNVTVYPNNIVRKTAEEFGVTKTAVFKYVKKLMSENILESTGEGRNINYRLKSSKPAVNWESDSNRAEDHIADETARVEKNVVEYKEAVNEKMNNPVHKVESKKAPMPSIAFFAAIVLVISLIFFFTLRQKQVAELNSALQRIEIAEKELAEIVTAQKIKNRNSGILELRKALLILQDAKNLIADDEIAKGLLTIEDDIKSVLNLPEAKEGYEQEALKVDIEKPSPVIPKKEETKEIKVSGFDEIPQAKLK
jgi:predicted transcriptional regulator